MKGETSKQFELRRASECVRDVRRWLTINQNDEHVRIALHHLSNVDMRIARAYDVTRSEAREDDHER
jgi:hypothetical protein